MDGGAWWAAVNGIAKSRTWLSDFTFTFHFPALEKEMATHSSVLAWRIPGTGEPGGLQSMGLLRVGHDWVTSLSLFTFMQWRRKWQPTPVFLPGESQGRGSLVGCRLWGRRVRHNWSNLAAAAVYTCSVTQLYPTLYDSMNCSPSGSVVHGFSRQEYWSLSYHPPGDLPHPGSKSSFPVSPAVAGKFFASGPPGKQSKTQNSRKGLPWWFKGKESACQCKRHRFDPWFRKITHDPGRLHTPQSM